MARSYYSPQNLSFLLFEVHELEDLLSSPHFEHLDRQSLEMMLDSAKQMADTFLFPHYEDMDRNEPQLENGNISVHPSVRPYLDAAGEAGWISLTAPLDYDGMQAPGMMNAAANFIFSAANNGAVQLSGLTNSAANLLRSFGTEEQKRYFLPQMFAGKWQGTMALTEPQAGSSLSDVTTSATPRGDGSYLIKGQKIYISGGDYIGAENVVHFVLARIDGAPKGTKGISLFVVPKYRKEGENLVFNDVTVAGLYHKMGQKGSPATHLMYGEKGDCVGHLLGEANRGLAHMFQMMNEARIAVGIGASAIASAAYYASLEFAHQRPQGRPLNNKDLNMDQVTIINHPDVRRMLLMQKAITEGSMSLGLQAAHYADKIDVSEGEEKEHYQMLLDILTPVVKTYPSEMAIQSISQGMQILGGGGFCKDFPLENYYRDIRIYAIYEGTTGIQSQDLLGRKVTMKNGLALQLLSAEILQTMTDARTFDELKPYAALLEENMGRIQQVLTHLMPFAMKGDVERYLADANLFMELTGITLIAWQWLKQATKAKQALVNGAQGSDAEFYQSKLHTMRYFFHYEVPKSLGLTHRLLDATTLTLVEESDTVFI
ncbi:MAG: acyl-CoA dehydrogenase [Bacteroidia bacterium]|nr:acyl-CoA dehydrogenase [Bacteroidia bacterium]